MCVLFDAGWFPLHSTCWKQAEGEGACRLRHSGLQDLLCELENFGFPTDRFFGDATDRHARNACLRFFSFVSYLFLLAFLFSTLFFNFLQYKKRKNMKQLQKTKKSEKSKKSENQKKNKQTNK